MTSMTFERERHGKQRADRAASLPATESALPLDRSTELALQAIADAAESCREVGPVVLDDEYLSWIALVEALPCNQSGADKTWLHDLHDSDDAYFRSCRQLP